MTECHYTSDLLSKIRLPRRRRQAKSKFPAKVILRKSVADGGADTPCLIEHRSPAHGAVLTPCDSPWVIFGTSLVIFSLIIVTNPLLDIAAHIMDFKSVGLLLSHRVGLPIGVAATPGVVV